MSYLVVWMPPAEHRLASLAADPVFGPAVVRAAEQLDSDLRADAPNMGESRPGRRRIAFEAPLGVTYRVDSSRKIVRVLLVWRFHLPGLIP
jgi:plasmid stabilization system protein ParE